jgi:hypothetical protein
MKSEEFIETLEDLITSDKYISTCCISTVDPVEAMTELIEEILSGKKILDGLSNDVKNYKKEIENVPPKPRKPNDWECCGSGCCPCVWDIFERDLEIHDRAVTRLSEKIIGEK